MKHTESGFTLLELMVTMSIVLILTAIAIPEFREYRAYAYDVQARMDLRTVAIAEEAYYLDEESYVSCENEECSTLPGVSRLSIGTQLSITADDQSFSGRSSHEKGSGKEFTWDSTQGGFSN